MRFLLLLLLAGCVSQSTDPRDDPEYLKGPDKTLEEYPDCMGYSGQVYTKNPGRIVCVIR